MHSSLVSELKRWDKFSFRWIIINLLIISNLFIMFTFCFRVLWNNSARSHRSHESRRPLKRRGQTTSRSWCRAGSRSTRWSERKRKKSRCRVGVLDGQRGIRASSAAGMFVLWARVTGQPRDGWVGGGGDAVRTVLQLWHQRLQATRAHEHRGQRYKLLLGHRVPASKRYVLF